MRLDKLYGLAHLALVHIYNRIPVAGKRTQTKLNAALAMWRAREHRAGHSTP